MSKLSQARAFALQKTIKEDYDRIHQYGETHLATGYSSLEIIHGLVKGKP